MSQLTSLKLNPPQLLHNAVHEVSLAATPGSAVAALFPTGSDAVLSTPGNKVVSITTRSNRAANRAGVNAPLEGLARGADRPRNEAFSGSSVSSTALRFAFEDELLYEDITDQGNVDPESDAAAREALRLDELEAAAIVQLGIARQLEERFYRKIAGAALDFTSGTAFTATAASGAPDAMNPSDYDLANPLLDIERFIAHLVRNLNISSGGMVDKYGCQLLLTPECGIRLAANHKMQGYGIIGDVTAGMAAVQSEFLSESRVAQKLMGMNSAIRGVASMDGIKDTAAASASENLAHTMGSVVGLTAMVMSPVAARVRGSSVRARQSAMVRHVYKNSTPTWRVNPNATGEILSADTWQEFTVLNSGLGVSYYDA